MRYVRGVVHSRGYRIVAGAALCLAVVSASGCTPQTYDGVLWRQVAAFKDPFGRSLVAFQPAGAEAFAAGLRTGDAAIAGIYWDGISDPAELDLREGGLAFFDVRSSGERSSFDAIISSGPRDPDGDGSGDHVPYSGPDSIHTCFSYTVEFDDLNVVGWIRTARACEPKLVTTLDPASVEQPISEFDG